MRTLSPLNRIREVSRTAWLLPFFGKTLANLSNHFKLLSRIYCQYNHRRGDETLRPAYLARLHRRALIMTPQHKTSTHLGMIATGDRRSG